MNDRLFAYEFSEVLKGAGYEAVAALVPQILPVQAAEIAERPSIGITGEYEPYLQLRKGTVSLELRSRIGDETEAGEHQARFVALFAALCGAVGETTEETRANREAAATALKAAFQTRGNVFLRAYGPARNAVAADIDGDDLRTVITLSVVWGFPAPL